MKIKFWGVRGSTPTPQPENMRYGGNTSCVELRIGEELFIFDCGTGFRNLGKQLSAEQNGNPLEAHVFLTHYHWDHIQGIPFFAPLYGNPQNRFYFHSHGRNRGLQRALEDQMNDPYFPVNMAAMSAKCSFEHLEETKLEFDGCTIRSRWLNHPQGCLGFRIETSSGTLVYATDNEPGDKALDKSVRELAEGADILICDAQYLPEQYQASRRGWGHSHWREAIDIAMSAGARELVLFHHDPDHDDASIDQIVKNASDFYPKVQAAYEGLELAL
ncbi:MAG TPA: MBL fold metallo-hydrolase [Candidatus Acidoferrales bacterium]|nr:MBL fold metallo-hydrolase [Candidatus Acidoferrales bacterium]